MERSLKKLLVTGGSGFIGSAFIRYLFSLPSFQGTVVNLDLLTYAVHPLSLSSVEENSRYTFIKGDICDSELVDTICKEHRIDTMVHFAAETHVDRSLKEPHTFLKTNIEGTFSLLEILRKRPKIHFHHISTDEVFGSIEEGFFTEDSPYRPNSPYSATKASSDHLVCAYHKSFGLSVTLSHSSNNFGPFQCSEKLIPLALICLKEKKPIPIYGKGKNRREWLFVEDHAEALWKILQKGKEGEAYGIGSGEEKENIELLKLLISLFAKKTKEDPKALFNLLSFVDDRPGHDFRYALDTTKIRKELLWRPRHSLEKGLEKTISWYFEQEEVFASLREIL